MMDAPRIQYAQTSDGVNVAYYAVGQGPPVVSVYLPNTHIEFEWRRPEGRRNIEGAARVCTYIRYDPRGFGMSEREVTDFAIDALLRDIDAIVDRLDLSKFALVAGYAAVPVAVAYAARNSQRLSHLVLSEGSARGLDIIDPSLDQLVELGMEDWELASESMMHAIQGWSEDVAARRSAAYLREAVTPKTLLLFLPQMRQWDVTDQLELIKVRTLVVQPRGGTIHHQRDRSNALAAKIPGAELVLTQGSSEERFRASFAAIGRFLFEIPVTAIDAFLREGEEQTAAPPELPSGTAVILFVDIADSTALTERLGDAAFRAKARELSELLRAVIRECGGAPVEGPTLGDGVLAVFTSAREAIEAAVRCRDESSHAGLPLHLGIHAGDVMRETDPDGRANVYGGAVNIAARISGLSAPGEVLVSDIVRGLARTSSDVTFEDRGEHELKGVGEPQRLFAVVSQRMENG